MAVYFYVSESKIAKKQEKKEIRKQKKRQHREERGEESDGTIFNSKSCVSDHMC